MQNLLLIKSILLLGITQKRITLDADTLNCCLMLLIAFSIHDTILKLFLFFL